MSTDYSNFLPLTVEKALAHADGPDADDPEILLAKRVRDLERENLRLRQWIEHIGAAAKREGLHVYSAACSGALNGLPYSAQTPAKPAA